jgi:hypothetical protein
MMRRGQAALEFLTTYGWALLVILVMIGALVYFGLLNPSKVLPNRCEVATGFLCKDFQINAVGTNISITNKIGEPIKDMSAMVRSDLSTAPASNVWTTDCVVSPTSVATDGQITISCPTLAFASLAGEKVKLDVQLFYTKSRGSYNMTMQGTVYGPVQ